MSSFVQEVSDADEHVHGPNCNHSHSHSHAEEVQNIHGRTILNRNEMKARNELLKLGLKPITGIHRVTFVRGKSVFAISDPEVYKNPTSDSYIVFGEARAQDSGLQAQMAAAQRMVQQTATSSKGNSGFGSMAAASAESIEDDDKEDDNEESEGEDVDTTGLTESDIKIVMEQANVSRSVAIKSLKEHDNDVVNTIMDLSM